MRQIAAYELIEKNMTENSFEIIADCGGCFPLSKGHRMFLVQNPLHAAVRTGAIQFQRSREALLSYNNRQTDFLGNTSRQQEGWWRAYDEIGRRRTMLLI
jgi:hypothetical protein